MKQTSSSVWTFQMIIIFMLIFAGFLALILTYSKAYTIKNRLTSIIEKYGGVTDESLTIMNNFAMNTSYRAAEKCPDGDDKIWYGVIFSENKAEVAKSDRKYNYCFAGDYDPNGLVFYEIQIFYKFNLPFLSSLGLYRIEGRTNAFRPARDIYM